MINIGIVGSGAMALERSDIFKKMPGVRISAIFTRNKKNTVKICQLTGAAPYTVYKDLLAGVDAVVVCNPNSYHSDFILQAYRAGKHVLCEYPICIDEKSLKKLLQTINFTGPVVMTGNTIIHENMFLYLEKNKSRLGGMVSAASRVAAYNQTISRRWIMHEKYRGPVFPGLHYHHIEYYRHFLGDVAWVCANNESRHSKVNPDYNSLSGGTLLLGHKNGSTSCIQWFLSNQGKGVPRGFWLNGQKSSVSIFSPDDAKSQVIWDDGGKDKTDSFKNDWGVKGSCLDFINAINGKLDYKKRFKSDLQTLVVGLAAVTSAKKGNIKIPKTKFLKV